MEKTSERISNTLGMNVGVKTEDALTVVPPSELDTIYRSGRVSPDIHRDFRARLNRGLSSEGMTLDQYIETNRRLKIEMKNYLDNYKVQRSLMEAVIYYLRHPNLAAVRFVDRLGGLLGKNLQLEAKKIANDPQAIRKLFEEMVLSIEQSRGKIVIGIMIEKRTNISNERHWLTTLTNFKSVDRLKLLTTIK